MPYQSGRQLAILVTKQICTNSNAQYTPYAFNMSVTIECLCSRFSVMNAAMNAATHHNASVLCAMPLFLHFVSAEKPQSTAFSFA